MKRSKFFNFTKKTYALGEIQKLSLDEDTFFSIKIADRHGHITKFMSLDLDAIATLREFLDGVEQKRKYFLENGEEK